MNYGDWIKIGLWESQAQAPFYTSKLAALFSTLEDLPELKQKCSSAILQLPVNTFVSFIELFPKDMQKMWLEQYASVAENFRTNQEIFANYLCKFSKTETLTILILLMRLIYALVGNSQRSMNDI
ncbi:hypothetical protein D5018_04520 [Parashewanella curva]|uniref:Uncharacterized protein n=1 Tax=Parashewanella curva TaxID=2338552 RepID=A0A3L8Q0F8_9GAMM|nr:hypothetical protein [Parashewanella curva]RLV60910.1 hypothetical protein D5018_04520 [Parashewanella curva]